MTYSVSQPCFRLLTLVLQCNQGYGSIYRVLYCLYMYNALYTWLFTITVVLRHSERLATLALVWKQSSLFFSGVFHSISSDFSCVKSKNPRRCATFEHMFVVVRVSLTAQHSSPTQETSKAAIHVYSFRSQATVCSCLFTQGMRLM